MTNLKIVGYVDLQGDTTKIRTRSEHKSLINKREKRQSERKEALDKKGQAAIEYATMQHQINKLKTHFSK